MLREEGETEGRLCDVMNLHPPHAPHEKASTTNLFPLFLRLTKFKALCTSLYPQCDPYIERKAPPWDVMGRTYNLKPPPDSPI